MDGLVITNKGIENISSKEIAELIKCKNAKIEDHAVIFNIKNCIELCTIAYQSQSIKRAVLLLSEFKVDKSMEKSTASFKKSIEQIDLSNWVKNNMTFRIECERLGLHDFHSVDIEAEIGIAVDNLCEKKYKAKLDVEYGNPELVFYVFINEEKGYFGIDFSGFDLAKRQYKIFNHTESLSGITGYALVRASGFDMKKTLLDPFMGSGIIPIEAGLFYCHFPVQYYNKQKLLFANYGFFKEYGSEKFFKKQDSKIKEIKPKIFGYDFQFRYLKAAQKNAKLAGIDKSLYLSKCEIEWLDTKLDSKSVDYIVSDPPRVSKHKEDGKLMKVYKELFYQAEYVLKKTGTVTLLAKDEQLLLEAAQKHKFKINAKYTVFQGKEMFYILNFARV